MIEVLGYGEMALMAVFARPVSERMPVRHVQIVQKEAGCPYTSQGIHDADTTL
jgi:hypothetical protein